MSEIFTVGLDLAKNVFRVHGADGAGRAELRKKLSRMQVDEAIKERSHGVINDRWCQTNANQSLFPASQTLSTKKCCELSYARKLVTA
jgi:SOS response regulatory protein OraA/RecX